MESTSAGRITGSLTLIGGGNTAFATAADLTLRGAAVTLCELPAYRHMVEGIARSGKIRLDGVAATGIARLEAVTTDVGAAVRANQLVLVAVPAYAHAPVARACAPHLREEQTVILLPGTLGSFEFAAILAAEGAPRATLAEADTSPYVCRRTGPEEVHVWGVVPRLGIGVLPATRSEAVLGQVAALFPGSTLYANALECGLSSLNPIVHPAGVLMNAGRIEYSEGDFYFYKEGITPGVVEVIEAVDAERRAVGSALGIRLPPVAQAFSDAGFGPNGDLWETINGSRMLTQLRAPGSLDTRWLYEDAPYGLVSWASLGEQIGVPTPTMRAVIDLSSIVVGVDSWSTGRTVAHLGLAGLSRQEILEVAEKGLT